MNIALSGYKCAREGIDLHAEDLKGQLVTLKVASFDLVIFKQKTVESIIWCKQLMCYKPDEVWNGGSHLVDQCCLL